MPTDKDSLKGFVDFNNTSQHAADSVMNKYFVGFPYSLPSQNEEYVSGIEDITDWVRNGYSSLYSRDGMPGYSFYTDSSGKVYRVSDAENINTSGMSPLSYSEMRKMLPKREYIGGKDYRFRTAQRIPGFLSKIRERAEAYGIDPNLVLNRILHEGWIDQQVINYNGLDASQQGSYWDGLWDAPVSGYGSFGLDYAGNNLMNGIYELKDPDASWREAEFTDYEGGNSFRVGTSLEADNLSSAIEILAAELAYRQGEVAKRYGKKGSDLNVWTNAAFNMGLNNDDFKNEDWVRNQYTYPDYYGQIETQKKLGGIIRRFGADKLQQYFASGGSISHRGRLTELKERTGKTEAELYNDARNARKWRHADGGLLRRFDEGGDKDGLWYNPDFDLGVYGGMIEPAVVASSPTSASAKYNIVKKQYKDARKEQKAIAKEIGSGTWYGPFYDYVNTRKKHFRSAQEMKPIWDRIEALPNIEQLDAIYERAKDNYYGQIGGVNSIPAQLYRFYSRRLGYQKHQSRRNNRPVITGDGADIIDLSNNVIRLSPNSEQSTALFNEFVEKKYPTVRKAADYKENQDLILGDEKKFPAKHVSIYGGIEDGKFKLDSLQNFNDTTTIIPARNIRRGTQRISKINIQNKSSDEYPDVDRVKWRLGYNLHEASAFNPFYALMDNYNDERIISAAKNLREDFRKKYGLYDENGEFNIKNRSSNLKKIDNAFGKILSGEKISYDEAGSLLSFFRNSGDQYIESMLAGNAAPGMDYQKYWPSSKNSDSKYYSFVGEDGTEYPISLYNAAILDGKTLLANPDGGVFVGRIQDISPAQLDSLNTYLESNPSWLMRPDLGSFDQYRLDNPSLETYLKQFFEHPKANDPNVYTVGTVTPNKLWEKRYGGLLKKYDGGGNKGELWYNPEFDLGEYGGMIDPAVVVASRPVKQKKNKENDELARAIVERLNNEEAAKARAEGAHMMGEKPLESEDYLLGAAALGLKAPIAGTISAAKSFAVAHPMLMRAIDAAGTIDGIRNLVSNNGISKTIRKAKEGDTSGAIISGLGDLFDIVGGVDAARMASKLADKSYRAYHAFNSFEPYGYNGATKKGKAWLKSMLSEKKYGDMPAWRGGENEAEFFNQVKDAFGENTAEFMKKAREDAWAIYLGQKPKNGMYVKNADGTFSYNLDKLSDAYKDNPNFSEILKYAKEKKFDSLGVTHGGLWDVSSQKEAVIGDGLNRVTLGNLHMEDMWDLHPFSRTEDAPLSGRLNERLTELVGTSTLRDKAQAFREWMYENGHWGGYGDKNTLFGNLLKPLDRPLNIYRGGWRRRLVKDTPDYVPMYFTMGDELAPAGYHYEDVKIPRIADNVIDALTDNKLTRAIDSKISDFDAASLLGGKSFYMKTDVPYTSKIVVADNIEAFNPDNFSVVTEFGHNLPDGYIDPTKIGILPNSDFVSKETFIKDYDFSNLVEKNKKDSGGLIERYGREAVLAALKKRSK